MWNIITEQPNKKTSQLIAECRALFPVWCWQEYEEFDKDFPAPIEATTREFKPNLEADEEHKNKSYNDLQKEGVKGITLRERLIMELQYFKETGKHLDSINITLCTGSLFHGGGVPDVSWSLDYGGLGVVWCDRDDADDLLRSREVVSGTLIPSSLEPLTVSENLKKGDKIVCKACHRPL